VERAEHRLKLVKKKVAQFRNDYDPKDPRNGAGNRHCAHLIRNAEVELQLGETQTSKLRMTLLAPVK
jgi:hypothetical protein